MDRALTLPQSRTKSPLALWPAVGPQERLWGTGILLPHDFCGKTMEAVMELIQSSQSKHLNVFEFSRVSPGAYPLTKKPEAAGYEIDSPLVQSLFTLFKQRKVENIQEFRGNNFNIQMRRHLYIQYGVKPRLNVVTYTHALDRRLII